MADSEEMITQPETQEQPEVENPIYDRLGEKIKKARLAGYSDEEIYQHLGSSSELKEKFTSAEQAGYKPNEIINHLITKTTPNNAKEATRHVLRTGARVGETLLGGTGDVMALPGRIAEWGLGKATKNHPEVMEGLKLFKEFFKEEGPTFEHVPTSADIREQTAKINEGYLEPQTKGEELSDEVVSDFASLFNPIGGKMSLMKKLALTVAPNAAKQTVKYAGGSEEAQEWTKLGTSVFLSLQNPKGVKKFENALWREADTLLPQGAAVNATNLSAEINALETTLGKGGSAASKSSALTKLAEIQNKITNGTIAVDELTAFKKSINEIRESLYAEEALKVNSKARAGAKRNLNQVAKTVDNALDAYGQQNPAWHKAYRSANETSGAIAKSNVVRNTVAKVVKENPKTSVLTGIGMLLKPLSIPITAGAYAVMKTGEIITRLAKSENLRHYYTETVKSALHENTAKTAKDLSKLGAIKEAEDKRHQKSK